MIELIKEYILLFQKMKNAINQSESLKEKYGSISQV